MEYRSNRGLKGIMAEFLEASGKINIDILFTSIRLVTLRSVDSPFSKLIEWRCYGTAANITYCS